MSGKYIHADESKIYSVFALTPPQRKTTGTAEITVTQNKLSLIYYIEIGPKGADMELHLELGKSCVSFRLAAVYLTGGGGGLNGGGRSILQEEYESRGIDCQHCWIIKTHKSYCLKYEICLYFPCLLNLFGCRKSKQKRLSVTSFLWVVLSKEWQPRQSIAARERWWTPTTCDSVWFLRSRLHKWEKSVIWRTCYYQKFLTYCLSFP